MAAEPSSPLQDRRLSTSMEIEQDRPSVESLLQVISDLQHSETAAIEDRDLADRECRRLRLEAARLRTELQQVREEDPKAKQIREVCDYWIAALGKSKRVKCPTNGARWNKVRCRMNDGYTVPQLKQAIDGCALMPFVGPRGRQATPDGGAKRHDDLELICRDETVLERFMGYAVEAERPHEAPLWATEPDPNVAFVRYAFGEDCKLPPSTAAPAPRKPRDEFTVPPVDKVIPALHAAGCDLKVNASDSDRWYGKCPAHDDRNPSLQVWRTSDGRMRMKCWTGCQEDDILRAAHLEHADCWRGSEYDTNAQSYQRGDKRSLPPHLRHTMEQLLARNERQAA